MSVNGKVVREMGVKVDPATDDIRVDGDPLVTQEKPKPLYIMLNKPVGYTSTVSDPNASKTVLELLAQITDRVYPVGRLDADSDGLLLMTNDGEFANRVTHPRYHVPKLYRVRARGFVDRDAATHLAEGVQLEDGMTAPATVRYIEFDAASQTTLVEITLFEGRNRQVRRMFDLVGHPVRQLTRVGFGGLHLAGLNSGTWRKLRPEEVEALLDMAQPTPTPPKEARRAKPSGPYRPRNAGNIARQGEEAAQAALAATPRPLLPDAPLTQSQALDRLASANNSFVPRNAFLARTPGVPMPTPVTEQARTPGKYADRKPRPGTKTDARKPHGSAPYSGAPHVEDGRPATPRPVFGANSAPSANPGAGASRGARNATPRPQSKYQSAAPQAVRSATPYERKLLTQAKASTPRPPHPNSPVYGAMAPDGSDTARPNPAPSKFSPARPANGNAPTPRPVGNTASRPASGNGVSRPAFGNAGGQRHAGNDGSRPAYGNGGGQRPAFGSGGVQRPAYGSAGGQRPAYGNNGSQRPAYGNNGASRPANGGGAPRPAFGNAPQRPAGGNGPQRPAFGNAPAPRRKHGFTAPPAPAQDGSTNNAEGRKAGIPYVARPRPGHAKFGRAKP